MIATTHAVWLATVIYCALLGLAVGSFLNVVVYRVPRSLSVIRPRSACPTCHTPIKDRDNIPVLSWLLLRGKCRKCHSPISARYPLVEVAGGALFAATAWRIGPHWPLLGFLVANAALLALALIDLEHMLLPRTIVLPVTLFTALWLTLSAAMAHHWHQWVVAVACSLVWGLAFWLLNFASPKALGFGDVRLAYLLGLLLGYLSVPTALLGFFTANVLGAVVGVYLIATKRASASHAVPYGVFLAAGTYVAFFVGRGILALFPHVNVG